MKTRWKILITILLAGLVFWLSQRSAESTAGSEVNAVELNRVYQEFNEEYFHDRLPHDLEIDWAESGNNMATTVKMRDGRFHIAFNEKYNKASRVMRETMLRELCHVKLWRPLEEQTPEEIMTNQHGSRWRSCMLELDMKGAFRREIIDFYQGE